MYACTYAEYETDFCGNVLFFINSIDNKHKFFKYLIRRKNRKKFEYLEEEKKNVDNH